MTVSELITELQKMPQDLEVQVRDWEGILVKVTNVEERERAGDEWVEIE